MLKDILEGFSKMLQDFMNGLNQPCYCSVKQPISSTCFNMIWRHFSREHAADSEIRIIFDLSLCGNGFGDPSLCTAVEYSVSAV